MTKAKAGEKPEKAEEKKTGAKPIAQQKLDTFGAEKVYELLTDGKAMTDIAKDAGVSFGSLQTWLESVPERSVRAREARRLAARRYDEEALEGIQGAKDRFSLDKAKEVAHHLRWRSSKCAPKEYGEKVAVGGAEDLPPIKTDDAEAARRIAFALAKGLNAGGE